MAEDLAKENLAAALPDLACALPSYLELSAP
jgi:hypothetical protein